MDNPTETTTAALAGNLSVYPTKNGYIVTLNNYASPADSYVFADLWHMYEWMKRHFGEVKS